MHVAQAADALVEHLGDALQVPLDERLDVPFVARLRPAALIVPAGRVLRLVRDLD